MSTEQLTTQSGEHMMADSGQPDAASPASTTPATPASPSTPPAAAAPTSSPATQATSAANGPTGEPQPGLKQRPTLGTPPATAAPTTQQPHADDPSVQRAGVLHSIAQALAGGPHYKYDTDINTGETKRTAVPLSGKQIGLAIAIEALTGSLAGLAGGRGKGVGAAGMAGVAQGQNVVEAQREREKQQQDMGQQNVARHYQVAEANMRMLSLAQTIGRQDEEMHNDLVTRSAPQVQYVRDNYPERIAQEFASEDEAKDLKKYPLNEYTRTPQGTVPRLDANGNQVWIDPFGKVVPEGTAGAHRALDNTYAIIRNFGASDGKQTMIGIADEEGTTDLIKDSVKAGLLPASWLKASPGSELTYSQAANLSHKVSALKAAEADLGGYYKVLNSSASDTNESASSTMPNIKDEKIASLIDDKAKQYGVDPALLRALVLTESGNTKTGEVNPKAVSPKGAKGLGQLMPATAKKLGVTDPFDPEQNLDGTARYLKELLKSPKVNGDPRLALSAYHGIGSDGITTDSEYSQKIMKLAGIGGDSPTAKFQPTDVWAEVKKDPSLGNALDKFQGMLNQTGSREAAIGALAKKDPRAASKIARLYGGHDALREYDLQQKLHEQRQIAQIAIDKQEQEGRNKQRLDNEASEALQKFLDVPQGFNFTDELQELKPQELAQQLNEKGVNVPKNFASLYLAGHYRAPISSFAPRVWNKGSKFEMDQQTAESYIQQFINPQFDVTQYGPKQKLRNELVSAQSKDGGSIRNASTAVQHLAMLKQASDAYGRHDIPTFNKIANWFNVQVKGDPRPADFKAIAEKVNAEVEKVAMGGNQPYVGQLEEGAKNLSINFGNKTTDSILKDYTKLMYGRLKAIDDNSYSELKEHLHNVSPEVTQLFRQYGLDTPWDKQGQQQQQQGQPQKATMPAGATMKVRGSDGHFHWSDGKQDLGVVQ